MLKKIIALFYPSVDSIVSDINKKVERLRDLATAKTEAARVSYAIAKKCEEEGDELVTEAARATKVANRLSTLIG